MEGIGQDRLADAPCAVSALKALDTMQGSMQGCMLGIAGQVFTMPQTMEHGLNAEGLLEMRAAEQRFTRGMTEALVSEARHPVKTDEQRTRISSSCWSGQRCTS